MRTRLYLHRVVGGGVAAGRHHEVAEQGGATAGHGALEEAEASDEVGRLRCGGDAAEMRRRCGGDVKVGVDVVEMVEMWWRCGGDAAEMRRRCGGDAAGHLRVDSGEAPSGGHLIARAMR
jgi:hypothetical protein